MRESPLEVECISIDALDLFVGLPYEHPVTISVEQWPFSEFIAHWYDIETVGFGQTKEDAIEDLKQNIVELYEHLKYAKDKELGRLPRRWRQILKSVVEEVEDASAAQG